MSVVLTLTDIRDAAKRISPYVHKTPVLTCKTLNKLAGRELYFKCENFQKIGAFKARGAANAVLKLDPRKAKNGVVTHSSGNHAQALAWAAQLRGIKAYIVMPSNAPTSKAAAVKGYGAEITYCEPTLKARTEACDKIVREKGAIFVPPYDDYDVMAGQGTMALEFLEEIPDLDCIISPISGGGMISGICIAAKGVKPSIKIFGAEPAGADDAHRSLKGGKLVGHVGIPVTICDGLRTGELAEKTWPIVKEYVDNIITCPDAKTREAMFLLWERMKLVIEPSGAIGLACALSEEFKKYNMKKVGIILSGGNLDIKIWNWNSELPDEPKNKAKL